jgi:hypothetical protein
MHFGFFVGHCACDWRFEQLIQMIKSADMAEVLSIQEHHLKYKRNPRYEKIEQALKERLGN